MCMKCKISDSAGYVQEMYSKYHMPLILEMCRTHEISDATGNVQEISCVLAWNCSYMKGEISDITGNLQEMSCFLVLQMYMKCDLRK